MPALAVTRADTRWRVTFANPPVNLVDPELILELQALVDQLERDPARSVLAEAKALIDGATLPAEADLVNAYETFFRTASRLAA